MTLGEALERAAAALTATSPSPRLDAEALLGHVTGLGRAALIARAGAVLDAQRAARLEALVARRQAGEPLAYLTGVREFWSLELLVTPDVLVPRPETELLVERALARLLPASTGAVADLGTGCGAIALAIARERPRWRVIATDASAAALAVARCNVERLALANVELRQGEWLEALRGERLDLIVSNPPYVPTADPHLRQGDVRFEPLAALVGGPDGLDAIRRVAFHARRVLAPGGWLLLEHGHDQGEAVRQLLQRYGYTEIAGYRDLAGHDRVSEGRAANAGR